MALRPCHRSCGAHYMVVRVEDTSATNDRELRCLIAVRRSKPMRILEQFRVARVELTVIWRIENFGSTLVEHKCLTK
jgi:hypothetical protein